MELSQEQEKQEMNEGTPTPELRAPFSLIPVVRTGLLAAVLFSAAALVAIYFILPHGEKPSQRAAAAAVSERNMFESLNIIAKSAIVFDVAHNKILFELNPDTQLPLASLTKIPLALAISGAMPLDTILVPPRDIVSPAGVRILPGGVPWRAQDIIDVVLVASSNNGAEYLAHSAEQFIRERFPEAPAGGATLWRMNDLARELGLSQTYFLNVTGLDTSETMASAYGSARDIAVLLRYAVNTNASVFSSTARGTVLVTSVDGSYRAAAQNTNQLESFIPGLIMGKTGFTDLAGGNLAVVFDVGIARPVIIVVLGSTQEGRFQDTERLMAATRALVAAE